MIKNIVHVHCQHWCSYVRHLNTHTGPWSGICTTPVVQNASAWLHEQPLPQTAASKLHNNNNNITKVQVHDIVTYCVNK